MAIAFFSSGVTILFFFSKPPTILSTASRKSCLSTASLLFLAAINAASLHTFAISAPEKPGVCLAKKSVSRPSTFLMEPNGLQIFLFFLEYLEGQHIFVYQIYLLS